MAQQACETCLQFSLQKMKKLNSSDQIKKKWIEVNDKACGACHTSKKCNCEREADPICSIIENKWAQVLEMERWLKNKVCLDFETSPILSEAHYTATRTAERACRAASLAYNCHSSNDPFCVQVREIWNEILKHLHTYESRLKKRQPKRSQSLFSQKLHPISDGRPNPAVPEQKMYPISTVPEQKPPRSKNCFSRIVNRIRELLNNYPDNDDLVQKVHELLEYFHTD